MKVDVILPVYGGGRWLREAVDSVFAQTFDDWHLWVVDDASPNDALGPLVEMRGKRAERLSILRLEQNGGAAAARMHAIRRGSAPAIAFLDQDDRWRPEKLALQAARLESGGGVAAVHTDVSHIDAEGRLLPGGGTRENERRRRVDFEHRPRPSLVRRLFLENSIRLGSSLVLRQAFEDAGGFRGSLRGGEDWEFWVRFADKHGIAHLSEPLLERRIHDGNTSTLDAARRREGALEALELVENELPELRPLGGRRRVRIEQRSTLEALLDHRHSDARRSARELARLRPLDWRTLALLMLTATGPLGSFLLTSFSGRRSTAQK